MVVQVSLYWILIILDYTFSYKSCKNPHTWGGRGGNTTFFLFLVVVFCKNTLQCICPRAARRLTGENTKITIQICYLWDNCCLMVPPDKGGWTWRLSLWWDMMVSMVRHDDCFNIFSSRGEPEISDNWEHHLADIALRFIMTGCLYYHLGYSRKQNQRKMKYSSKLRWRFVFILSGQLLFSPISLRWISSQASSLDLAFLETPLVSKCWCWFWSLEIDQQAEFLCSD